MPLFQCSKCNSVENTALCNHASDVCDGIKPRCSECETGKWHGRFPKRAATGMTLASDGFLYSDQAVQANVERFAKQKIRVVGKVQADGSVI